MERQTDWQRQVQRHREKKKGGGGERPKKRDGEDNRTIWAGLNEIKLFCK